MSDPQGAAWRSTTQVCPWPALPDYYCPALHTSMQLATGPKCEGARILLRLFVEMTKGAPYVSW